MTSALYLPFLENLGFAIIHSFWQIAIIWLSVICIRYFLNISIKASYTLSLLGQLVGFGWFLYTVFHPYHFFPTQNNEVLRIISENKFNLIYYISFIYIILLLINSLKLSQSIYNAVRIRRNGVLNVPEHIRSFVDNSLSRLEIKKKVKISLSYLVNNPLTLGFIKPVILLPIAILNHLTQEQLEAIILHELIHIKRKDYIINIIQIIIEKILYFNPFIKLIGNISRAEREKICDYAVVNLSHTKPYAEALFILAKNNTENTEASLLNLAATGTHKMELLERIKIILGVYIQKRFISVKQLIGTAFIGCIAVGIPIFLNKKSEAITPKQQMNHQIISAATSPIENTKWEKITPLEKESENINKNDQRIDYNADKVKSVVKIKPHKTSKIAANTIAKAKQSPVESKISAAHNNNKASYVTGLSKDYKISLDNVDSIRMLNQLINTIVSREGISESGSYFSHASYEGVAGKVHVLSENTSYIKTANYVILLKKDNQYLHALIKEIPKKETE